MESLDGKFENITQSTHYGGGLEHRLHFDLLNDDRYQLHSKNVGSQYRTSKQTVKGNLPKHIQFWREISTSKFIFKVIEEGYRLPFKTICVASVLKK